MRRFAMIYRVLQVCLFLFLGMLISFPQDALFAQTINAATNFTYQGYLEQSGSPVTGTCNFQFSLFNDPGAGSQIGTTQTATAVSVNNGVFSAALDFGEVAFNGIDHWLAISADCDGMGYVPLTPRQAITPAPYALGMYGLYTQPNATSPNVIGGFVGNLIGANVVGATISGGGQSGFSQSIQANYSTIGGGVGNEITESASTIGGGVDNSISAQNATISGGVSNSASNSGAAIGGGEGNTASGGNSVISGGGANTASGIFSAIGGGASNTASENFATIPGGFSNAASGLYSFAAGFSANAIHDRAFVWSGSTSGSDSFNVGSFTARAPGGVRFYSASTGTTTGVQLPAGTGAWASLSDRNSKDNFQAVDTVSILNTLVNMPIGTWNYIEEAGDVQHIGPVAQDFYAAFNVGADDRYITTVDADGVALAAIQGLYHQMQAQFAVFAGIVAALVAMIGVLIVVITRQNRKIAALAH